MNARSTHFLLAIFTAAALLGACNGGEEETAPETPEATETAEEATPGATTPTASPLAEGQAMLRVTLAADNEVPNAGDREMSGSGTVRLNASSGEVCPDLDIEKPEATAIRAAHIHRGPAGENGPVVIPFESDADGVSDDCVTAEAALVNEVLQSPDGFYVNVHTERYPDGAIRGQLAR